MTTAVDVAGQVAPRKRSFLQRYPMARRLLRHKAFVVGAGLFLVISLIAIFADLIAPSDPSRMAVRFRFRPPSADHWLGTDNLGRSQLSRIVYGARLSLGIGLAVVIMNAVFGVALGAASGYFKRLDNILMRVTDALMAFPPVLLALGIAAALGPSSFTAAIALADVDIPRTARIVRASVLVVREMEFVQAASRMYWRPSAIMLPQVGVGGGDPKPRKLSVASVTTANANTKVSWTIRGARQLGSTCFLRMRKLPAPIAIAAWTNSISRTTSTEARTIRAVLGI